MNLISDTEDPFYGRDEYAGMDGKQHFYERLELDIPIYQRDNDSTTVFQKAIMKVDLIKEGVNVNAVFHRFLPPQLSEPIANWNGFWTTDPTGLSPPQEGVRIPRRFLPITDNYDEYLPFTGIGNGISTFSVECYDAPDKTIGWMYIATIDNAALGHGYIYFQKLKKTDDTAEFKKNHSGLLATEHQSWLTDSAYSRKAENTL